MPVEFKWKSTTPRPQEASRTSPLQVAAAVDHMAAIDRQMQLQTIKRPAFAAMAAGSNSANFGSIVDYCISHGIPSVAPNASDNGDGVSVAA